MIRSCLIILAFGYALLWPHLSFAEHDKHGNVEILEQKIECLPIEEADALAKERGLELAARGRHVAGIPVMLYRNEAGQWWVVLIGAMPSGEMKQCILAGGDMWEERVTPGKTAF
tara:strand:- start:172 stop:516 length:345 start_codon:yes stop_codon:yes gene_type:complete